MVDKPQHTEGRFLFVAIHKGPYLTLRPLELAIDSDNSSFLADGVCKQERKETGLPYLDLDLINEGWGSLETYIYKSGFKAIIRGTSEDVAGDNVEDLVSAAALTTGTPLFVIEDLPGNYRPKPQQALSGLFAESDSLAEVYRTKGIPANLIHYVNNVRYAHLKNVDKTALRDQTRGALDLTNETVMLWAGQPDDKNSYLALERLLPSINELGALLLFRPHPRDEYFATGAYTSLLQESKVRYIDVSYFPDITGLVCAADLVATQFSSVAVEAGHLGIPSLYVLFPDLGQQFLLDHKGYRFPPWCNDGCAYLIERENQVQSVLSEALNNQISRKQVCTNFSSRFGSTTEDIEVILQHITRIIEQVNTSTARPAQA